MWNSRDSKLCVVCDVGSATVSAGLVLFVRDTKPTVLWTTKVPFSIAEKPNQNHLEGIMFELLEQTFSLVVEKGLPEIHKQGIQKRLDEVFVTLASPWFIGKASTVKISKDEPFILDEKIIADAISDEEKKFEADAVKGLYDQVRGQDIRMIEREMVRVLLNGYETKNPYDKLATIAEVSLYMSIIPERILSGLQKLVRDHLPLDQVTLHTFPLTFFAAVTNLFPHSNDYMLIDVAGESTDMSLVRDGTIIETTSFPVGRNALLRSFMSELSVTEEIAFSYLHLGLTQNAEAGHMAEIQTVMSDHALLWSDEVRKVLTLFSKTGSPPHACFMVSDDEVSAFYSDLVKKIGEENTITHIVPITAEILSNQVVYSKGITNDSFISLEALHLHFHTFASQN